MREKHFPGSGWGRRTLSEKSGIFFRKCSKSNEKTKKTQEKTNKRSTIPKELENSAFFSLKHSCNIKVTKIKYNHSGGKW